MDSRVIPTAQAGLVLRIYRKLFADLFFTQSKLRTRIYMSTGQHLDADIDPQSYGLSIGYAH